MGITFDREKQCFVFDFEHDGVDDIVSLTGGGYQVEAFGKCFYYGYEFADSVDGGVRTSFIKYVKFSESIQKDDNLTQFIQKAINDLNRQINLYDYDLVVMPESSSKVNQYMLRYIYRYGEISYIGGGFGVGIHNVLEAAVYGIPVIFGPNNKKFREAQHLLEKKGGFEINGYEDFEQLMNRFLSDEAYLKQAGKSAGDYVKNNSGALEIIMKSVTL